MSQGPSDPLPLDPRFRTMPEWQPFTSMLAAMSMDHPHEALGHRARLRDLGWLITATDWSGGAPSDVSRSITQFKIASCFLLAVEAERAGEAERREMWLDKMRAEGWEVSRM